MKARAVLIHAHDDLTTGQRESAFEARRIGAPPTTNSLLIDDGTMGESTTQPIAVESEYASEVALHSKSDVSDYGSDFDLDDIDDNDTTLADVLDAIKDARPADKHTVLPSIEFEEGEFEDEEYVDHDVQTHRHKLRVAKGPREGVIRSSPLQGGQVLEVEYDERSRRAWSGTYANSMSMIETDN